MQVRYLFHLRILKPLFVRAKIRPTVRIDVSFGAMLWLGVSSWTTIKLQFNAMQCNEMNEAVYLSYTGWWWWWLAIYIMCVYLKGKYIERDKKYRNHSERRYDACAYLVTHTQKRILGFVEQQSNEADHSEIDCIDWNSFVDFIRELNITNINKYRKFKQHNKTQTHPGQITLGLNFRIHSMAEL